MSGSNSEQKFLDIIPDNIDKGEPIKYLAKELNYKSEEIYVFGDSMNDVGMFLI